MLSERAFWALEMGSFFGDAEIEVARSLCGGGPCRSQALSKMIALEIELDFLRIYLRLKGP
jgi:hypothetical protein